MSKSRRDDAQPAVLGAGSSVSDFAETTVEGRSIGLSDMESGTVVGFFSPTCEPCKEVLPTLTAYAAGASGGREQVFAVVVGGTEGEASTLVAQLSPVATVLAVNRGAPILTSFAASGYPAPYLMGASGLVAASGHTMEVLPQQVLT